jgi:transposase
MNAYSKDLRMRVLAAVDRGDPYGEISRLFEVSLATIGCYVRRRRETGEVAPRPSPGRTPRICKSAEERRDLWEQLEASPEATLEEHRETWGRERGVRVSVATMSRAIRRLGWTYKQRLWRPPSATKKPAPPGASG